MDRLLFVKDEITNKRARGAIERLEQLYALLKEYGVENYITFDLGMLSKFGYYTGIIFRAFTFGTGDAVVTGGRYDSLVGQFGKQAPAIGMAVIVNQLMMALDRQNLLAEPQADGTLIVYSADKRSEAVAMAKKLRGEDRKVSLYLQQDSQADYEDYAKRMHLAEIVKLA